MMLTRDLRHVHRARNGGEAGFTLVEVLIAAALLLLIMSGATFAMIKELEVDRVLTNRADASRLVERLFEETCEQAGNNFDQLILPKTYLAGSLDDTLPNVGVVRTASYYDYAGGQFQPVAAKSDYLMATFQLTFTSGNKFPVSAHHARGFSRTGYCATFTPNPGVGSGGGKT